MANVEWSAGIDSVSGALSKPSKKGQHSCNKMLLGTHRVAATENPQCNRLYLRKNVKRSTPPSENEQAARARFSAVAAMVKARRKNLNTITADQEAFKAQLNTAGGHTTFKGYLWEVCGDEYDQQH
jgi:hypothetical protein